MASAKSQVKRGLGAIARFPEVSHGPTCDTFGGESVHQLDLVEHGVQLQKRLRPRGATGVEYFGRRGAGDPSKFYASELKTLDAAPKMTATAVQSAAFLLRRVVF
jgi:hypothetical protein